MTEDWTIIFWSQPNFNTLVHEYTSSRTIFEHGNNAKTTKTQPIKLKAIVPVTISSDKNHFSQTMNKQISGSHLIITYQF